MHQPYPLDFQQCHSVCQIIPLTLELITKVGIPLVGPSANLSTKPSPTKVEHVFEDMNGRIRGILDGGFIYCWC